MNTTQFQCCFTAPQLPQLGYCHNGTVMYTSSTGNTGIYLVGPVQQFRGLPGSPILRNALEPEITTQSRKRCFTCTSVSASFRIHNMVHCFPTMHSEGYIHFFIFGISTLTFGGVLPTYTIHKGWNR